MQAIIISAADSGFFSLLQGLLASLQRFVNHGKSLPQLGILDLGLTPEERRWLGERHQAVIIEPEWDFDFADRDTRSPTFKAQTARPFLPRYFPGFDLYIWMDADLWLQEYAVLEWLVRGSRNRRLAITQELHSAYKRHYDNREIMGKYAFFNDFFNPQTAETYGLTPSLNVGVFALPAAAPHWEAWRRVMRHVLSVESSFYSEQVSLDFAVYSRRLPVTWLPARANWLCHQARPAWDPQSQKLVDPCPPHHPLWVVHLTMATKEMGFLLEIIASAGQPGVIETRLDFFSIQKLGEAGGVTG